VGYTLINGTASVQLALLIASVYNAICYSDLSTHTYF